MYLPRETLNVLYKLYVRPHLDYGDVIYHIPHKESTLHSHGNALMQKIESVQYPAALAVTGTWRGTSREKLYCEVGWESLHARRWSRRLFMLYKIINNLLPEYISESIPRLNQPIYTLRNQPAIGQIRTRTDKFKAIFFLIAYMSGVNLTLILERPLPSMCLRVNYFHILGLFLILFSVFMTLVGLLY